MITFLLFIMIGLILLIKGADFLVDGASNIAKKFHISDMMIGLTIVSIGTSMPELFVAITSSFHNASDISVGNIIGSNLCNILFILGATAIIKDIQFHKNTKYIELPFLILTNIILFILVQDGILSQRESCLLIFLFICFITYTYFISQKEPPPLEITSFRKSSLGRSILAMILGILALKYGGEFVVENAKKLAKFFHVSDKIIGCTIIAIGTSLPELITSIISALKGNTDLALGNIIGSNIFNILLILGTSSFIHTIHFNLSYDLDIIILYTTSLLLFLLPHLSPKKSMSKKEGFLFLGTYLAYMLITVFH